MALKIEFVFIVAIVGIVIASFTVKLNDSQSKVKPMTKELEFTDTTFTEVDTKQLQGRAHGMSGVREKGVLTVYHLQYHTNSIDSLVAKKGTYMGKIIYLEGDVVTDYKDGYHIETQQAEYNQKSGVLNVTAPFVLTKEKNLLRGDTLTYNAHTQQMYGTMIDATLYTVDK